MIINLLVAACLAQESEKISFKPSTINAPFLEQFTDDWKSRWIPSAAKKIVDGVEDDELLKYRGLWEAELPEKELILGDKGLVLKSEAAHSAISALFKKPIDPTDKDLVVQYEFNAQKDLVCGGAYLKLFTYDESFSPEAMIESTPYTIMFGPDKCGGNNKVHFIFRHKNPKNGKFEEKHLKSAPVSGVEKGKTSLYTLIVKKDNSFEILVNNISQAKGSLLEDFEPSVNPPKEIDDPNDKEPEDWVHEAKIKDPNASKPDDWDEDAPKEIPDESAVKPEGWLDDAPATIPDPDVQKPEDWDDEEDGEWTAPSIPNPACESAPGCGKWVRPTKKNPAYRGKWTAPLIDNPAYKGEWKPKKIANPDYFEDAHPSNFNKMGAIGFELWTMESGLLFDNIYVGHSIEDAEKLREEWKVKTRIEKELEPKVEEAKDSKSARTLSDNQYIAQAQKVLYFALDQFERTKTEVFEFVDLAKDDPVVAVKEMPQVAVLLAALVALPILSIGLLFSGSSPKTTKKCKCASNGKPCNCNEKDNCGCSHSEKKEAASKSESPSSKKSKKKD